MRERRPSTKQNSALSGEDSPRRSNERRADLPEPAGAGDVGGIMPSVDPEIGRGLGFWPGFWTRKKTLPPGLGQAVGGIESLQCVAGRRPAEPVDSRVPRGVRHSRGSYGIASSGPGDSPCSPADRRTRDRSRRTGTRPANPKSVTRTVGPCGAVGAPEAPRLPWTGSWAQGEVDPAAPTAFSHSGAPRGCSPSRTGGQRPGAGRRAVRSSQTSRPSSQAMKKSRPPSRRRGMRGLRSDRHS